MSYYLSKKTKGDFKDVITKVTSELMLEGFEVLNETNLQEIFKKKLNVNVDNYIVLSACNPSFIFKAYMRENKIGTLLPCNVVVQETDEDMIEVSAIDPTVLMVPIKNDKLIPIAAGIKQKLEKVINAI